MKNRKQAFILLVFLAYLIPFANSQTQTTSYINISTGTAGAGNTDPNWYVMLPNPNYFLPVKGSTGLLEYSPSNIVSNDPDFAVVNCGFWPNAGNGTWISPYISGNNNLVNKVPGSSAAIPNGNYMFRINFYVEHDDCNNVLDFIQLQMDYIGHGNQIKEIRYNDIVHNISPTWNGFYSNFSFVSPSNTNSGWNFIDIVIENTTNNFVGLQVCGKIEIRKTANEFAIEPIFSTENPCLNEYPTPFHVVGIDGEAISLSKYKIDWEYSVNGTTQYLLNSDKLTHPISTEMTITVTITDLETGCVYVITYECEKCQREFEVAQLGFFNPCSSGFANNLYVVDENGNVLEGSRYSFLWDLGPGFDTPSGNGVTNIPIANLPITVMVTDHLTDCVYTLTFLCPCNIDVPSEFDCDSDDEEHELFWNGIPGATGYEIEVHYYDPECCANPQGLGDPISRHTVVNPNYTTPDGTGTDNNVCFSWRVRGICISGSKTDWSDKQCSCGDGLKRAENAESPEIEAASATIYPNPSEENFNLNTTWEDGFTYIIMDITGKMIVNSTSVSGSSATINLSEQTNGIYILRMYSGDETKIMRLIKQ